jgi:hypothetical protein
MVDHPLHHRIHLSRLCQEVGPPLTQARSDSIRVPQSCCFLDLVYQAAPAPYLAADAGKYSKEQLEFASDSMREAILGLLRFSAKPTNLAGNDFIKKSLIVALLEKGPTDFSFVRTISDAARWNIEIYDYKTNFPKPSNVDAMKDLCYNFHYSNIDEPVPVEPPDFSLKTDKYTSKWEKNGFRILALNSKTNDVVCEIYPTAEGVRADELQFHACSYDYWTDRNFGDCRDYKTAPLYRVGKYVPKFFTLAPNMVLKPFQNARAGQSDDPPHMGTVPFLSGPFVPSAR